ncbi:MAG TPA: energy-coupling factor transporter ATPase [Clostridia bacterium]|nr:energy-coupling factor transporter ATPase [Clostridia bacterium]
MSGKKENNALICLEELHFTYDDAGSINEMALSDISLNVSEGEFLALIGPNGSGKSTLARHLNALLLPTHGRVLVNGLETGDERNHRSIRQLVGMVFQNPENQFVASIVEDDVAFGPENLGLPQGEIKDRVDEALSLVGLEDHRYKPPHFLSGGQKQLLAIAGILAMRPKCLILDEPTAMLDPTGRKHILSAIKRLNRELGMTVILVTNFMEEAAVTGRLVVLNGGRIVMEGPPEKIFSDRERLKDYGLGLPPTVQLADSLRGKGLSIPGDVTSFEGLVSCLCRL